MAVLLTGGAGYIGSHCYYEFLSLNKKIIVIDNLSTGFREALPESAVFYKGNAGDKQLLKRIHEEHKVEAVVHFAGSLIVEDSVYNPAEYYHNNVVNSLQLLEFCIENDIKKFIFSSTASLYGSNPKQVMEESDPVDPENPYAETKLVVENMIKSFSKAHGLNYVILRYFNVAGADPELRTGQLTKNATHLIKVACELAAGKRESISIFGTDYETPDGTCIRDYIHVSDLASAHLKAVEHLFSSEPSSEIFNCGYGVGYSVKEVLAMTEVVSKKKLNIKEASRRAGDPVALVADSSKIKKQLFWKPQFNNLEYIIQSALNWEIKSNNPECRQS